MARAARRYLNLVAEIDRLRARRIAEIGTCKGDRAEMMIDAAMTHGPAAYFGFDLFGPAPDAEMTGATVAWPIDRVRERLDRPGAAVGLLAGDTREMLPRLRSLTDIDLVFVDGGHSEETVRSDFSYAIHWLRPGGVMMLDDYWNYPGGGGCNALVDGLDRARFDVAILEPADEFRKPYGTLVTRIARVEPK